MTTQNENVKKYGGEVLLGSTEIACWQRDTRQLLFDRGSESPGLSEYSFDLPGFDRFQPKAGGLEAA